MSAISYSIGADPNLELVTAGTSAPGAGEVEIRIDTTSNAISDSNAPGSARALKRGEIQALIRVLEQFMLKDTNIPQ